MPSSSPFFPPPPVREHRRRTVPNYAASPGGRNAPSTAAVKAGPNREIIMCGLTVPLIQVSSRDAIFVELTVCVCVFVFW